MTIRYFVVTIIFTLLLIFGCTNTNIQKKSLNNILPPNLLDYSDSPVSPEDRNSLAFSDQGAWFAFGFPTLTEHYGGFSGPFLMTQENGVWCSPVFSQLHLRTDDVNNYFDWNDFTITQFGYNSHLKQIFESSYLKIEQTLFYNSPHTVVFSTNIINLTNEPIWISPSWSGKPFPNKFDLEIKDNAVIISSDKSTVTGYVQTVGDFVEVSNVSDTSYLLVLESFKIKSRKSKDLLLTQTFISLEYNLAKEQEQIDELKTNFKERLESRIEEKEKQLQVLYSKMNPTWNDSIYKNLVAKTVLTLQNNWRIPTGQLKHSGLFPSYHYLWFHGFWAWDSWKHAVALAQYDPALAKEQIRAMYDFQCADGFIPDCIFRDTAVEQHNYRNTKPPLSAWAVWKIYEQDNDLEFIKELYPKLTKQHKWWYTNRDHDQDGLCEYGSTDGSLIAAKWESGMDNAVRFDDSMILKNSDNAYSLDQESVDLNAYLFAEKKYLINMAKALQDNEDVETFKSEAKILRTKIQEQFFDSETGWFYDTSLDGKLFIKVMGCEGWIPLWAKVATPEQAKLVKVTMMDAKYFNTYVPFQTLSASHPEFKPDGGYWRGPNWLDQAYFGVMGLKNYDYQKEANQATFKLIHNAEGVLSKGKSIRENYNPITGKGLEAENFSWSAAHYLLLLLNE